MQCEGGVKTLVGVVGEELVGSERSECVDSVAHEFVHGRSDDVLFFVSDKLFLTLCGVQCEYRNSRIGNLEVAFQAAGEGCRFLNNEFFRDVPADFRQWYPTCCKSNSEVIIYQHVECFPVLLQLFLNVFSLTVAREAFFLHLFDIDRTGDNGVDMSVFIVFDGMLQCDACCFCRLR